MEKEEKYKSKADKGWLISAISEAVCEKIKSGETCFDEIEGAIGFALDEMEDLGV